jgi:DNA-binding SARP family transcriptional activator
MRFQTLGPLRIWDGARWTFLPAQQRVVLAMLLANVGRMVGVEQLIDEIWGTHPPRAALATVQVYVSRLRKLLGWGVRGPLSTFDRGYQLVVEPEDVDAQVFDGLATAGRRDLAAGRLDVGVERLSRALALWRGPALADVPSSPRVDGEIARLERALATYRDARDVLLTELGLEPGPELRDTQRAVLGDDPRLSVAPRAAPGNCCHPHCPGVSTRSGLRWTA